MDVATIGETMVLFTPLDQASLRHAGLFQRRIAGAESNVAIGLARLGHRSGWISRLGDDALGRYVLATVRGEGVDTSQVRLDKTAPTGLMVRDLYEPLGTSVGYYRVGSAASRLGPDDVPDKYIGGARIVHVTGITPALSESCRTAARRAVEVAAEAGVVVSFDPNLRLKLWDVDEAREATDWFLRRADIVLPSLEEGRALTGLEEPDAIAAAFLALGARVVALKLGEDGALIVSQNGERIAVPGVPVSKLADPVGAGDAFAAAFLSGWLRDLGLAQAGAMACAAGALAVGTVGDVEGLPYDADLRRFMKTRPALGHVCR